MPDQPHPPGTPARIAILEDDEAVREHFIAIVTEAEGLELVGTASTIAAGDALLGMNPDLFLCDIGLPDGSGLDFIPLIKARTRARALVITAFGDRETVVGALAAGADGYLLKDTSPAGIIDGIEATLAGGAPISASAAVYLLEKLRPPAAAANEQTGETLTPREIELLKVFARGRSYKQAARDLDISPLTVGSHVKSIYRKLAVNSRGEAVFQAVKSGAFDL